MSFGIVGPIGVDSLADFAISRAFRVTNPAEFNKTTASCKLCGESMKKGTGRSTLVASMAPGQVSHAYLCAACVERVEAARLRFEAAVARRTSG
jgi:hypothetical protein